MKETFDSKEALALVENMINSVKSDIKDNGFHFMLWGWLVFAGASIDYVMLVILRNEYHSLVWAILMPLGGIISVIAGIREARKPVKVRTYIDDLMKYVVRAFCISLLIICLIMPMSGDHLWQAFYPVLMLMYAVFLFISGAALRFKPLIIGGLINWATCAVGFFATYDQQLVLLAFAVLSGYIIPGHILKYRFGKNV